jgi:hypothetical protein
LSDLAPLGMDDELARELWGLVSPLPIEGAVDLDKDVAVVFAGEQECVPRVPNVEAIGLAVERASSVKAATEKTATAGRVDDFAADSKSSAESVGP